MPKLGSKQHPAILRVRSMARAREVLSLCQQNGWQAIVGVESDKTEDVTDLEKLLRRTASSRATLPRVARIGRNDPCPCGSGLKYKRCCDPAAMGAQQPAWQSREPEPPRTSPRAGARLGSRRHAWLQWLLEKTIGRRAKPEMRKIAPNATHGGRG